jgi:hypothetical protein
LKHILIISFLFLATFSAHGQSAPVVEQSESDHRFLEDSLKDISRAIHEEVIDTVESHVDLQKIDSVLLKNTSDKAKGIIKDSINNISPALGSQVFQEIKEGVKQYPPDSSWAKKAQSTVTQAAEDSLNNYVDLPEITLDSTTSEQIKSRAKLKAKAAIEQETKTEIPKIQVDSITTQSVKQEALKHTENALKDTDEFNALESMKENKALAEVEQHIAKLTKTQEEINQAAAQKQIKQKMTAKAKDYITANASKITQAQSEMSSLKKKYSSMPNSNDLSSATKRTSLEGESLWKRLVIGGNFNISKTNPLSVDLSPVLGYKVNKLFEIGITGAYRAHIAVDKSLQIESPNVYGYSVFGNHMLYRGFFGYLEGERLRTAEFTMDLGTNLETDEPSVRWKQTLLVGVGRRFNVSKWLEMQALMLVNVIHDNEDGLYGSPVVFKTGVRLRK